MRNTPKAAKSVARPHRIHATAVYYYADVCRLLRLSEANAREEIDAGRLRVSLAHKRYRFIGRWLIEWIERTEQVERTSRNREEEINSDGCHSGRNREELQNGTPPAKEG